MCVKNSTLEALWNSAQSARSRLKKTRDTSRLHLVEHEGKHTNVDLFKSDTSSNTSWQYGHPHIEAHII